MDECFDPLKADYDDAAVTVHAGIVAAMKKYDMELEHPWSLTGFITNPNFIEQARIYPDQGKLNTAAEEVVRKIYHGDKDMDAILQQFFSSMTEFRSKAGSFGRSFPWSDPKLKVSGQLHLWHLTYTKPFHSVFGHVASIVTAQLTGGGGGERNWAHLEHIWKDSRVHLGVVKAQKQLLVFEGHRREMAMISDDPKIMPLHKIWTSDEVEYDLGLTKWDVVIDMSAGKTKFNCFLEGWEPEAIKKQSGPNEFRLLQKYKGVLFFDDEESTAYKIVETNVEWKKKDKSDKETPCYCVLAKPVGDADDDDTNLGPFHINEELFRMIKHPDAGHAGNFEIIEKPVVGVQAAAAAED